MITLFIWIASFVMFTTLLGNVDILTAVNGGATMLAVLTFFRALAEEMVEKLNRK